MMNKIELKKIKQIKVYQAMQQQLYRLVNNINRTVQQMSARNSYYPPKIDLTKEMTSKELLIELEKLERFLRVPQLSYLNKDNIHIDLVIDKK